MAEPPSIFQFNRRTARDNVQFVEQSIIELLEANCAQEVHTCPNVCSPLSVVCNASGKQCLVLDLRYVNEYLWKDMRTSKWWQS